MGPGICEKHGSQNYVLTSPLLEKAIIDGKQIQKTKLIQFKVESFDLDGEFNYVVDIEFLSKFMGVSSDQVVILKDRDKASKQLNDRLLIQEILREMKHVCPVCLKDTQE
ncbi:MAG: hypothetical protein P8179_08425 [Candidatus Thiodiazotropha sp.]|jgi:uncharacterized protein YggU (UPF0235/DUF167 family)